MNVESIAGIGLRLVFCAGNLLVRAVMRTLQFIIAVCLFLIEPLLAADETGPQMSPDAALSKLKAGNEHFAGAANSSSQPTRARRMATAKAQHPFAVIVGCSDSRTPPELIFDQNLGDLFVVRTAGNLADDIALGSIEYAVEHLGARLIVVLGHARCGAVAAAMESASAPGHVGAIVSDIQPAIQAARKEQGDALVNAIRNNIDRVAKKIKDTAELGSLAAKVQVVGAYYDLDTGKVNWLNDSSP
jgi:carbonic anhydrase